MDVARLMKSASLLGVAAFAAACETVQDPAPTRDNRPVVVLEPTAPTETTPAGTDETPVQPDDTDVVEVPDSTPDADVAEPGPRDGIAPAHLAGSDLNRLGLLLPLSSSNARLREEAEAMLDAAQLALFERDGDDTVLIVRDTGGTAAGAASAARAAMDSGADVILGPVLAGSVRAASREAVKRDVPVIAFSTDTSVAAPGTYLLSFPPEAEVARVVDYVAGTGVTNFAVLRPENAYGERVDRAYRDAVARAGGQITASETYGSGGISAMQEPARRLAEIHSRAEAQSGGRGKQVYEAVLLPEGGTELRSLAPLLPFYSSTMNRVQFLGTALWMREDTAREPALSGGLFAGPDQDARAGFERAYQRAFGSDATRLASLAHDAVEIGAVIADGDPRLRQSRALDLRGFYGADGFVRFNADGTPARGLAVYEVRNGTFRVVDPAPTGPIGTN